MATIHSITKVLNIIGMNENIWVTNIYAPHRFFERIKLLHDIGELLDSFHHPYKFIASDINIVVNLQKKMEVLGNWTRILKLSRTQLAV